MKALNLISEQIPVLHPTDSVKHAQNYMRRLQLAQLPLVDEEKKLLGIVWAADLRKADSPKTELKDFAYQQTDRTVHEHDHVFDVLKIASQQKLDVIPVLDKEEKFVGSITIDKLMNYFAEETDILQPGGIIVLEMNASDYSLTEIARIVESQNAHVIGLFVGRERESAQMEIIIKLDKTDVQNIVQSFERFNYTIKETFQESEYFHDLKERYDSLMSYLNL
jgi:acetoin utilization protein AcuB